MANPPLGRLHRQPGPLSDRRGLVQVLGAWVAVRALTGCSDNARRDATGPLGPGAAEGAGTTPGTGELGHLDAFRLPCPKSTAFPPTVDDGLRHGVTRFSDTNTADWVLSGISASLFQLTMPDALMSLLRTLGTLRLGYPLTVLDHSLQTATLARRAGASDDIVLAALLHHVGMTLSIEGYAELSASIVRGFLSDDAYRVVRHLPEYSCKHYGDRIGQATTQRTRYEGQPFHADAARLADDWERIAYDPDYPSLPLEEFEPLLRQRFTSVPLHDAYPTQHDCL